MTPPIIMTKYGPVTECARHQAALNMREDPAVFDRVLKIKLAQCGGNVDKAIAEMRRCYPEAFS
jgi:hypothetical protein